MVEGQLVRQNPVRYSFHARVTVGNDIVVHRVVELDASGSTIPIVLEAKGQPTFIGRGFLLELIRRWTPRPISATADDRR